MIMLTDLAYFSSCLSSTSMKSTKFIIIKTHFYLSSMKAEALRRMVLLLGAHVIMVGGLKLLGVGLWVLGYKLSMLLLHLLLLLLRVLRLVVMVLQLRVVLKVNLLIMRILEFILNPTLFTSAIYSCAILTASSFLYVLIFLYCSVSRLAPNLLTSNSKVSNALIFEISFTCGPAEIPGWCCAPRCSSGFSARTARYVSNIDHSIRLGRRLYYGESLLRRFYSIAGSRTKLRIL